MTEKSKGNEFSSAFISFMQSGPGLPCGIVMPNCFVCPGSSPANTFPTCASCHANTFPTCGLGKVL
ncbi:MAG: hypothetical protein WA364_30540 [Candidatus Nitrosopolaris sp.]